MSPLNPLTTIFTPPPGCFDKIPDTWSWCRTTASVTSKSWSCFWSLPPSCYPIGASTEYVTYFSGRESGTAFPWKLHYSPGVLPSGYTTATTYFISSLAIGCIDGWDVLTSSISGTNVPEWCTSRVTGRYIGENGITSGVFSGLLPHIEATWQAKDLPGFTPASAPVLPYSIITKYEASVAAASAMAKKTTSPTLKPKQTSTVASGGTQSQGPTKRHSGLSNGAKAGIGASIGAAFLLLLGLALVIFRRRHNNRATKVSPSQEGDGSLHLGSNGKLSQSIASNHVSPGINEILNDSRTGNESIYSTSFRLETQPPESPPPIPLASKPRYSGISLNSAHELQGEFRGSEVGDIRSPTMIDSREID